MSATAPECAVCADFPVVELGGRLLCGRCLHASSLSAELPLPEALEAQGIAFSSPQAQSRIDEIVTRIESLREELREAMREGQQ